MPLTQARKALIVETALALSVGDTIRGIGNLAVYWPLQERNAHGPQLIVDGDMELPQLGADLVTNGTFDPLYGAEELSEAGDGTADKDNFNTGNNATLTNPSVNLLRVARNTGDGAFAWQNSVTTGKRYLITGEARSDGVDTARPRVREAATIWWDGTTSTDWQSFSVEVTPTSTQVWFETHLADGTEYCEFRNLSIVEVNPEWTLGDGWSIGSALELVENGDFANWTADDPDGWSLVGTETGSTFITEVSGKARFVTDAGVIGLGQVILTVGKAYKISVDVTDAVAGTMQLGTFSTPAILTVDSVGTFTTTFIADSVNFRVQRKNAPTDITLDNISVTEVHTAHCDGTQVAVTDLTQDILVVGRTYDISWDVSNYQAGNVAALAGTAISALKAADGSYTERVVATATTVGGVQGDATFLGDVDNVIIVEVITLTNWTDGNDAALTKETGDPYEGLQVLRVAYDGTNNPRAHQDNLVTDKRYLVTGVAKSDSTGIPRILNNGGVIWLGVNTHTNWQSFDFEFDAGNDDFRLAAQLTVAGYVEFDAISVVELIPEAGGSVAHAENPEHLLGRNWALLTFADYTGAASWSDLGNEIAHSDGTQGGNANLFQDTPIENGQTVRITWTVLNRSAGSIKIVLGSAVNGVNHDADGTFVEEFTLTGATLLNARMSFQANVDFVGDVDLKTVLLEQLNIASDKEFPGADVIVNGDFTTDTDWDKETGVTISGGKANWVDTSSSDDLDAQVDPLTIGIRYKVTFTVSNYVTGTIVWRNDGGNYINATSDGTFSIELDVAAANFLLRGINFTGSVDNVSAEPANPLNGDSIAVIIGQAAGLLGLAYLFDGIVAYINLLSAALNSILNPESGGVGGFIHINSAAWTDSTVRYFLYFFVDSDNFIGISKDIIDNTLLIQVKMGGTDRKIFVDVSGPDEFIHVFVTWTQNEIVILINGFAVATLLGAGDWIGNLTIALIGASSVSPDDPFYGYVCHVPLYASAPSISDVKSIAESGGIISAPTVSLSGASGFSSGFSSGFE